MVVRSKPCKSCQFRPSGCWACIKMIQDICRVLLDFCLVCQLNRGSRRMMARLAILLVSLAILVACIDATTATTFKSYIVYMGNPVKGHKLSGIAAQHHEMLASVLGHDIARKSIFYNYKYIFNGFAALLPEDKVGDISKIPGVVLVMDDHMYQVQTTRSWEFLGLENMDGSIPTESLWNKTDGGQDVVIGMLDTGIWPESKSFDDKGYAPIPADWNGFCVNETDFNSSNCNRKIIGAKYYINGYRAANGTIGSLTLVSPRDTEGHGTHTTSIAAGSFVKGANFRGYARGTAKGGAFKARIAVYKICWEDGCADSDVLAAFDEGVKDGVDVFSLSLGAYSPLNETQDPIAIGALYAALNGISVVMAAGNAGPTPGSVVNISPWVLTVAASTLDRQFPSNVILGDLSTYFGESVSDTTLEPGFYPLVSAVNISSTNVSSIVSMLCLIGSLDPQKTKGKIVACERGLISFADKGRAVLLAGGIGMIVYNSDEEGETTLAAEQVLPATHVGARAGRAILAYINSTRSPTAYISPPVTSVSNRASPEMAGFSSEGPNVISPEIIKPDITAPGVNILAAFSEFVGNDSFVILSGTSMACPHVTGVVALLKSLHPTWSPARLQSAIITTGRTTNNVGSLIKESSSGKDATPFNYGGGQLTPNAAADPGLVYDSTPGDYFLFFCRKLLQQQNAAIGCPAAGEFELNYPSISVTLKPGAATNVTRTLTSVVQCESKYKVSVECPRGISVSVTPSVLSFANEGDKMTFQVTFSRNRNDGAGLGTYVYGSLTWSDEMHRVKSPVAVRLET